ncbi:MAG: hypothetical protein K6E51_03540 [Treponema sp.]|nr:hypothetical protein [Treponema sp.]
MKLLLLVALLTFCTLFTSAILVGHFVKLNYEYIENPESSPGYNENTPFGDGGDVWRELGIYLPSVLLTSTVLLNAIGTVMHFCASPVSLRIFVLAFLSAMISAVIGVTFNISPLYLYVYVLSFFLIFADLVLIPAGIVCAIVLLFVKKFVLAGHIALLSVCLTASFAMEMFSCFLYLD